MPLASGTRLGTYEILAPLGAGGMGEVYRARDLRLGREIALKALPAEMSADAERLARFEREARTVAGLNHPNIVTLFSVGDHGEVRFLTMELVEGQSLDRSVRPADCRSRGRSSSASRSPTRWRRRTRSEAVDARTDLFALGVVFYELASGRRPFTGETHVDVSHAILRDDPTPLASARGDLPPDLIRIVSRCLEKNPRERMPSALDESNELRRLRKKLERSELGSRTWPTADKVASTAVLPFVNRSASTDDECFSDGLADELLNVLSEIKGLRVTARTSRGALPCPRTAP